MASLQGVSVELATFPTWADKCTGSDEMHTANWLISCSHVHYNEGASRGHGEVCRCSAGTERAGTARAPICLTRLQPSWALQAVGYWFAPITPFSTSPGPIPGRPSAPTTSPSLEGAQMPIDTPDAGGEEPVTPSHPLSPGFGRVRSFRGETQCYYDPHVKGDLVLRSPAVSPALDPAQ